MDFLHFFKAKSLKFTSLFLLSLLVIIPSVSAQDSNPYSRQWATKGETVLSGSHQFTERYTTSSNHHREDKWWIGGFWMDEEDKEYITTDEVMKAVNPVQGEFTLKGPGVLLVYVKASGYDGGPHLNIRDLGQNRRVSPYTIRMQWNDNKSTWADQGRGLIGKDPNYHSPVQPEKIFNAPFHKIREGETRTFKVQVNSRDWNNFTGTGEWAFPPPQKIDYEIWYFALEGGKIISSTANSPDYEKPKPGTVYYTIKECY